MKKKYILGLLFFGAAVVAVINYRTPFFQQEANGYGLSLYRFFFHDGSYTTKRKSPFLFNG